MTDATEMSAAEAGLSTERQIQIALQALVDLGGVAEVAQLYDAVQRNMPLGVTLSRQGRDTFRSLIHRDAVEKGWIEPHDPAQKGWRITVEGRVYVDQIRATLGVESEDELPEDTDPVAEEESAANKPILLDGPILRPFDASAIRVDQRMMSIFQVMRKISSKDIDLYPEFQRNFVWNFTRQSRLIESILLRIPLPAFYLDATKDDRWLVVDGLQRLSTLFNFCTQTLTLSNLEFLTELDGKRFESLPRTLQRQIEDTELNLYIIRPETPPKVKFTIFSRVNTGGLVLTPQEIRHALFQGRATTFLAELSQLPEFIGATLGSVSPLRMEDRECALRFLAFHMTDYTRYGRTDQRNKSGRLIPQNLDGFLSEAMERLNQMDEEGLRTLRESFRMAMVRAQEVFGSNAFRKMYSRGGRRSQISKPLFEIWSVLLLRCEQDVLVGSREKIVTAFIDLMGSVEFNKSISLGTGSARAVQTRFRAVEALLIEATR